MLAVRESAALHKVVGNTEQRELLFGCNIVKYELDVLSSLYLRNTFSNRDLASAGVAALIHFVI